jgi:hypothetical protein
MYKECGLTSLEIDAAMARARELKDAARQLMDAGRVIRTEPMGKLAAGGTALQLAKFLCSSTSCWWIVKVF